MASQEGEGRPEPAPLVGYLFGNVDERTGKVDAPWLDEARAGRRGGGERPAPRRSRAPAHAPCRPAASPIPQDAREHLDGLARVQGGLGLQARSLGAPPRPAAAWPGGRERAGTDGGR